MMNKKTSVYFSDGKKTIDFILVYKKSVVQEEPRKLRALQTFMDNLKKLGLFLESEPFEADKNLIFVKIHAADASVILYSDLCNVNLAYRTLAYRPTTKPPPNFMATPLTQPDPDDPIYQRSPESISSAIPKNITSAERILVVHKLLLIVRYGQGTNEYGIEKMQAENLIFNYFPIHEGPYQWTDAGPLTDRQLLSKYWGSYNMWYKQQPLHLVERYYGPEFAFYFAWMDHFIKMLLFPALLSIFVIIYGIISLDTEENLRSKEICESQLIMCPRCHYSRCKFEMLNSTCTSSKIAYLFDNTATYVFAILVSLWSTVFTELWQRTEAVLRLKWNLRDLELDTTTRPDFLQKAQHVKWSPVTESEEPYIPVIEKCVWYTVTFVAVILAISLIVLAVVGVMIYRITVNAILLTYDKDEIITKNRHVIASTSGALMSAIFIISLKQVFKKISLWLTHVENHRTQFEFDNAYVYKVYGFEFVNNYAAPLYIAFFKGRFFTHPGDMKIWNSFGGLGSDICGAIGCNFDLGIQLIIIMLVKTIFSNLMQYFKPIIVKMLRRQIEHIHRNMELPFYQEQFIHAETDHFFLVDEYIEVVIQYGFVIFFIAAFPLAPLLALVTSAGELRTDAGKITKHYRRPIPQRVTGLGAWLTLLHAATYVGAVTNTFIIVFTSNAVDFQAYRFHLTDQTSEGFFNTTISAFDRADFSIYQPRTLAKTWCYYPGRRYPPNHRLKYKLTSDFWFLLGLRFLICVIIEHVLITVKGILAYAIPDIPSHVVQELEIEKRKRKSTFLN